jgi:hypothetical protein
MNDQSTYFYFVVVVLILSLGSLRGFWVEELGFSIYVKIVNISPVDLMLVALTSLVR